MKRMIVAAAIAVSLAGCANTPLGTTQAVTPQQAQANTLTAWYQGCLIYHGMQPQIAQKVTTLPVASAQKVLIASHQLTKLCTTTPTDPASAAAQVTAAVTTISVIAAIPTK